MPIERAAEDELLADDVKVLVRFGLLIIFIYICLMIVIIIKYIIFGIIVWVGFNALSEPKDEMDSN